MWAGDETRNSFTAFGTSEGVASKVQSPDHEVRAATAGNRTAETPSSPPNVYEDPTRTPGVLRAGDASSYRNGQSTLPVERAYSIQIGWRLFRLSGAGIMSDAPSYFSAYFSEQVRHEEAGNGALKTLYIDRDPDTFADICRHLQGYYLRPRDSAHFVKLYADAQYYSLPRLISQLFESDMYTLIGGREFVIPRDSFSGPGNSANLFSLGFTGFWGTREDAFPGLESKGLMRPPPVPQQSVPNRSPEIFADLIQMSRGYPLTIRDANHRAALLGDCKYYGFKGLMHKIFAHEISYNAERGSSEIVMRLQDLYKSGVSLYRDASASDQSLLGGWVYYSRPFVDDTSYEVVVEIGNEETKIDFRSMRADFFGDTKARISSLFQTVADKMNLPSTLPLGLMMAAGGASAAPATPANTPLSEDRVKIHIGPDAHVILDGQDHVMDANTTTNTVTSGSSQTEADEVSTPSSTHGVAPTIISRRAPQTTQQQPPSPHPPPSKKRKRKEGSLDEAGDWIVKKGLWRIRVQPKSEPQLPSQRGKVPEQGGMEVVLWAVKLDAVGGQRGRNIGRGWLG